MNHDDPDDAEPPPAWMQTDEPTEQEKALLLFGEPA